MLLGRCALPFVWWQWITLVLISQLDVMQGFSFIVLREPREKLKNPGPSQLPNLIRSVVIGTEPHIKKSVYFREPKNMSQCLKCRPKFISDLSIQSQFIFLILNLNISLSSTHTTPNLSLPFRFSSYTSSIFTLSTAKCMYRPSRPPFMYHQKNIRRFE
jgi:hypothetical protein